MVLTPCNKINVYLWPIIWNCSLHFILHRFWTQECDFNTMLRI